MLRARRGRTPGCAERPRLPGGEAAGGGLRSSEHPTGGETPAPRVGRALPMRDPAGPGGVPAAGRGGPRGGRGWGGEGWGEAVPSPRSPHGFSKPQANTNLGKGRKKKIGKKKKNVATMLFTHFLQKACVTCCWKGSYKGFPVAAWAASGPAPPRRAVPAAPSPRPVSCKTRGRDLSSVAEPPSADWPGRTHLFPDKPPSHGWLSINLFKKVSGVVKAERESVCVCKRG